MARTFAIFPGSIRRSPPPTRFASYRRWPAADLDGARPRRAAPTWWPLREHPRRDRLYAARGDPAHVTEPQGAHLREAGDAQPDGLGEVPRRQLPDLRPRDSGLAPRRFD